MCFLKPLFGRPGPPGLKCTSAAAPTLQQTVACGLWGFKCKKNPAPTVRVLDFLKKKIPQKSFVCVAYCLMLTFITIIIINIIIIKITSSTRIISNSSSSSNSTRGGAKPAALEPSAGEMLAQCPTIEGTASDNSYKLQFLWCA